ncbi:MAG: UDP-N-acetylmuramoyl-L-alanyl-D-glutamate--2,6-diaminopimelate ligase [Candidatus Omnitrophica bacterium]|nr:UDP-N-acetylmuramoyl-L-alanyl-D-glutamate--2,6-diaminopimelate ligase [Candidatus Omnitrophota bacterium]
MKLGKVLKNISGVRKVDGKVSVDINGIASDSKAVKDGYLFIAVKGSRYDGLEFIEEAIDKGAVAILSDAVNNPGFFHRKGPTFIYVDDARRALSEVAREFYGDISSKMRLIGVTGTNGKTTTTYLLEALLGERLEKTGVIGTINYRFGKRLIPAANTTPGALDLYFLLSGMRKSSVKTCILEVSSHSLEQGRVDTLQFDIAVFTNLTSEHLDYHGDMENYFLSKLRLFSKIKEGGFAIVNRDDPFSDRIIDRVSQDKRAGLITYGIGNKADVMAKDLNFSAKGLTFNLCPSLAVRGLTSNRRLSLEQEQKVSSSLIGRHNVYNILAASACGIAMGMGLDAIRSAVSKVVSLPGRLEKIDCGQDFLIFVDYAHTENGLENALKSLREIGPKRLFSVFGCGGDRDRTKRPVMGRVSTDLSDKVFITSDNPRREDPIGIINEITSGISKGKNNYVVEQDRFKAIEEAIKEAQKGDIVLVAGKGHETYQIFKNVTLPFDDREVVRKILKRGNLCLQSKIS